MKRWWVVTPIYLYHDIIDWEIGGPLEETCDAIEVDAATPKDAIAIGVRIMLADRRQYQYCRDQRLSDASPYTGVRAEAA